MSLTPCSYLGVQYALMLPRILQTLSPSTDWSIYPVHFNKNLATDWSINEYLSKDVTVYDDAKMLFVAMELMLLLLSSMINICWKFGLGNAIFLLQKENPRITVTETDSTVLLFLSLFFFGQSMVFVTSPATSTQLGHLKIATIPPSCPNPHWGSRIHKQGQTL